MKYQSVFRPGLFEGRVAIVTGGGTGIGRCIAHELAALGAKVVLASRTLEKLQKTQKEIEADGGLADSIVCNIRIEAEVQNLVAQTLERHGRIDYLVNNGGGQFVSPIENISLKGWNAVIETNLTGPFLVSKEVVTRTMADHGGVIVNMVAEMSRGMPMMGHSGAARAAVVNLTKTAALEWAQYGVRVNAVAPGLIDSSGFESYPPPVQEALRSLPKEIPVQRFGTEAEVASCVTFLLSPAAAYVTGATFAVDGASSLYRHAFQLPVGRTMPAYQGFHRGIPLADPDGGAQGGGV